MIRTSPKSKRAPETTPAQVGALPSPASSRSLASSALISAVVPAGPPSQPLGQPLGQLGGPRSLRPVALESTHDVPIPEALQSDLLLYSEVFAQGGRNAAQPAAAPALANQVTLHIYAWHNANPGALMWQFPDVEQAVRAVRVLRNAIGWAVVRGNEPNLARARLREEVLIEQS